MSRVIRGLRLGLSLFALFSILASRPEPNCSHSSSAVTIAPNLVPRVSPLHVPSLAPWDVKRRDPGNEVALRHPCSSEVLINFTNVTKVDSTECINYSKLEIEKLKLAIIKDYGVRLMISIAGSLYFPKLMMTSFAPAKSAGDARYTSQDPFIQSTLSHIISTSICIRSAFFLRRTQ